jgi:gluconolactonase
MGKLLDSPNDVVASSKGAIYFSNPTYELGANPVGEGLAVLYIDPTGTLQLIEKTGGLQPNGIALSPDETRLYAEIDGSGVKTYDLDTNGVPSNGPKDFTGTTDGMSVDCAGNLYLSSGAIIGPDGTQVGTHPGGTMAAFGGADGKSLIVVEGTGVHISQMNIPGPPH